MGYLSFGHSDSCGEDECVSGKGERLVKVRNVSKKFCRSLKHSLWYGVKDLTSELMGRVNAQRDLRKEEFWAVKDVSFDLKRGECLGLIGRNGAGKSTILKMLGGLIKPDTGFYGTNSWGGLSSGQVTSAYTDSSQQQDQR